MQLFKSEWMREDRRDVRPHAYRALRYGTRYGTAHIAQAGKPETQSAWIVHGSFARDREILQLIARYDCAA